MNTNERLSKVDRILQELQVANTLDTTEVIIPTVIGKEVEEAARAVRVMRNLVRVNRDLVGTPGITLKVPKRGVVTAATVNEGASIAVSQPTYETVDITPTKLGTGIKITQEALDASQFNLIDDFIREAGEALALKEDSDIVADFLDTGTHPGIITRPAETPGTLAYDDVVGVRALIMAEKFQPDTLVIHPDQAADLLKDSKFINASAYGSTEPIQNGEIGKISGMKVFVTSQMTPGKALLFDSKRASILVQKRDVAVKRRDNPDTDSIEIYLTMMQKPFVVNEKAVGIITNC